MGADSPPTRPMTVIGFGSLLSQRSALTTFPTLQNFRFARVRGVRRVFRHPAGIFYERGIVPTEREFCSLSVEPCEGHSLVVSVMEIEGVDEPALAKREEEYDLVPTPFFSLEGDTDEPEGVGLMCLPFSAESDKETFIQRWGAERWESSYGRWGHETIWGIPADSGALPCPVYLRSCVLAATKAGQPALDSFMDGTFLVDRTTTVRMYLRNRPDIMETEPPESLRERYGG
eukprot:TRINITY_DN28864_c0_g1_i1.p1 TRINITY_DN28864_c0_g1~~TRINITY_DN28864_c0_g1_i1.p1  ORF type:complete len:239 (+),score=21.92 TRINITY_DN28864_c0_g1_i1:27-719(+)